MDCLCSIITQLLQKVQTIPDTLLVELERDLPKSYDLSNFRWRIQDFNACLNKIADHRTQPAQRIYIVLDAVDQSPDATNLIKALIPVASRPISLLFTSRHGLIVDGDGIRSVAFSDETRNTDIQSYVNSRVRNDTKMAKWPSEVKDSVSETIIEHAAGMYVFPTLCLPSLMPAG